MARNPTENETWRRTAHEEKTHPKFDHDSQDLQGLSSRSVNEINQQRVKFGEMTMHELVLGNLDARDELLTVTRGCFASMSICRTPVQACPNASTKASNPQLMYTDSPGWFHDSFMMSLSLIQGLQRMKHMVSMSVVPCDTVPFTTRLHH